MKVRGILAGVVLLGMSFSATLSMAYPAVGDKSEWTGSIVYSSGTSAPVKVTREVLSYNDSTKKWTVKEDKTVGDKTESKTAEKSWLFDSARYTKIIAVCTSKNGTLETVTVPAGTYATCVFSNTNDEVTKQSWLGDVPFGYVKTVRTDNDNEEVETLELSSVTPGQ